MPLPKISQPIFQLTLPSNGKVVHYRPFTVREEKLLLMAQESGEKKDIINVYKQLINNCAIDQVDVDNMAAIDLEYFFLCLRSKSVSNVSKVLVKDADDQQTYEVEINLDKVEVFKKADVPNNIKLTDTVGVVLKYPTFSILSKIEDSNQMDTTLSVLRGCIHQIYEGEEVFETVNYSKQEMDDFILSLNKNHVEQIQKYFESMPKLVYDAKYVTKDKVVKELRLEGLENFF
jgi:T4 bacteriophage base plate protein